MPTYPLLLVEIDRITLGKEEREQIDPVERDLFRFLVNIQVGNVDVMDPIPNLHHLLRFIYLLRRAAIDGFEDPVFSRRVVLVESKKGSLAIV